jgi:hypothetical protein
LTFHIQAQNWIGSQNFIDLYNQSDLVVFGTISNVYNYKQDTTKAISNLKMPLKSLVLFNSKTIKGNFNSEKIYYNDIFNGCGYAPILVENILAKETLIFANIKNDSIFQIGSMNESAAEIANAIKKFEQLNDNLKSNDYTHWFYESIQNEALFDLLNHNISFNENPLAAYLDSLKFSSTQRIWLYNKIVTFNEYNYDNEGIIKLLVKYNDNELREILKGFIVKLKDEPYSDIDDLMTYTYQMTGHKELDKLIKKFNNDWREKQRKKVIEEFIRRI